MPTMPSRCGMIIIGHPNPNFHVAFLCGYYIVQVMDDIIEDIFNEKHRELLIIRHGSKLNDVGGASFGF